MTTPLQSDKDKSWSYTHHDSDVTLIWFCGISEPLLNPGFLAAKGINLLCVRDVRSDWYISGSLDFVQSFESLIDWIHTFLVEHGSRFPIFAGQSSGGYAALRAAKIIEPCLVIAFAPQTASRSGPNGMLQPPLPLPALDVMYRDEPVDFPIVIHISRSESDHQESFAWDDWAQIAIMRELPNVTLVVHPSNMHAVTLHLLGKGRFYDTVISDIKLYSNPPIDIP